MKSSVAVFALLSTLLFTACGGGDTAAPEPPAAPETTQEAPTAETTAADANATQERPGWRTYAGAQFSIQYPAAWNLSTNSAIGAEFALFAPGVGEDVFAENINMIIQGLAGREAAGVLHGARSVLCGLPTGEDHFTAAHRMTERRRQGRTIRDP